MSVTLDQTFAILSPGQTLTLTADVTPNEAAIKTVMWSSSDPAVAVVTGGVVTATGEGTAMITAITKSGQKTATCTLIVAYAVTGVILDKASAVLPSGKSLKLTATVLPNDAPDKSVKWESSNPDVATVEDGVIIAKMPGTATITVTTVVGNRTEVFNVKVVPENYRFMSLNLTLQQFNIASFLILGSGTVNIDWGDGSLDNIDEISDLLISYYHNYSNRLSYTITIGGENITHFYCNNNNLTNLDVSNNTALTYLDCYSNQLTSLDVRNNTALTQLDCSSNQLSAAGLNALFEILPERIIPGGSTINISNNPGSATCDPSIATNRGWLVF